MQGDFRGRLAAAAAAAAGEMPKPKEPLLNYSGPTVMMLSAD